MPLPSVYLNDVDLEALGVRVQKCTGPWDAPERTDLPVMIPGRLDAAIANRWPEIPIRNIQITGAFARSLGSRASLLALVDQLKAFLHADLLEVRLSDQPSRIYYCRGQKATVQPTDPVLVSQNADFTITLPCLSALAYDQVPASLTIGAVPTAVPLGTGPSLGWLVVAGATVNHVITYRSPMGDVLGSLGFTRSLGGSDYQVIDVSAQSVARYVAGVAQANAIADLTSGDFFALDPADGDYYDGWWPSLEISGLGVGGSCTYFYRKAWQ